MGPARPWISAARAESDITEFTADAKSGTKNYSTHWTPNYSIEHHTTFSHYISITQISIPIVVVSCGFYIQEIQENPRNLEQNDQFPACLMVNSSTADRGNTRGPPCTSLRPVASSPWRPVWRRWIWRWGRAVSSTGHPAHLVSGAWAQLWDRVNPFIYPLIFMEFKATCNLDETPRIVWYNGVNPRFEASPVVMDRHGGHGIGLMVSVDY